MPSGAGEQDHQGASKSARMRSDKGRLAIVGRERFTKRVGAEGEEATPATRERGGNALGPKPPGQGDEMDEKKHNIAHRRIVAGREARKESCAN